MITKIDSTKNSTNFKARIDQNLVEKIAHEPALFSNEAIDSFHRVLKEVSNDVEFNSRDFMDIDFNFKKAKNIIFVKLSDLVDAKTPDELLRKITPKKINDAVKNIILPKDASLNSLKDSFKAKDELWQKNAAEYGIEKDYAYNLATKGRSMMLHQSAFIESLSPKALENMSEVAKMEHIDFKLSTDKPFSEKNVKVLVASNNQRAKGSAFLTYHEYCDVKDIETRFTPELIDEFESSVMSRTNEITDKFKRFINKN